MRLHGVLWEPCGDLSSRPMQIYTWMDTYNRWYPAVVVAARMVIHAGVEGTGSLAAKMTVLTSPGTSVEAMPETPFETC